VTDSNQAQPGPILISYPLRAETLLPAVADSPLPAEVWLRGATRFVRRSRHTHTGSAGIAIRGSGHAAICNVELHYLSLTSRYNITERTTPRPIVFPMAVGPLPTKVATLNKSSAFSNLRAPSGAPSPNLFMAAIANLGGCTGSQ
jgi:hypothetical protein